MNLKYFLMAIKQMHLNKPQLRSLCISAPVEIVVAGRATGKTTGILAPKSANCYLNTMPRGSGVILTRTYTQCFGNTLPELIRGWEMFGYRYGEHFLVGQRPTEKWKRRWRWQEPYAPVVGDYKYIIPWFNGAIAQIISQERPGSTNGKSIDWVINDEMKFINQKRFTEEVVPANRGIIPAFANNPYHHGMTFTTDMPTGSVAKWILDYANKMDIEKVNQIWKIQLIKFKLKYFLQKEKRKTFQAELTKQIEVLDDELNELRRNLVFYHEASTLDNIHALGIDFIKQQLRDTTTFQFDTQILNLKPLRLEDGFYPDFDEEVHGYFSEFPEYFDKIEFDINMKMDCRKDADLDDNAPLHIAMDPNRRIHAISVGQVTETEIKSICAIHSLYPDKLKKAVQNFCDYYIPKKRKLVYYWYDQTSVGDMFETKICDDVVQILRKNDWTVIRRYLGAIPGHEERYRMWGDLLTNSGKYDKTYAINRDNCKYLILSKQGAGARQARNGFEKNKETEHDLTFPAEESTHFSDAEDTWVFGILESGMDYKSTGGSGGIIV